MRQCREFIGKEFVQTNPDEGKMIAMRHYPGTSTHTTLVVPHGEDCGSKCRSFPYHHLITVMDACTTYNDVMWIKANKTCQHGEYYEGWAPVTGLRNWKFEGYPMFKVISKYNNTPLIAHVPGLFGFDSYDTPNGNEKVSIVNRTKVYKVVELLTVDGCCYVNIATLDDLVPIGWIRLENENMILTPVYHDKVSTILLNAEVIKHEVDTESTILSSPISSVGKMFIHDPYNNDTNRIEVSADV